MDEVYDEGERIHIDDFDDYDEWGNGSATTAWGSRPRSRGGRKTPRPALNVNVIRSSRIEEAVENSGDEWLEASTDQGFVAYLNVCTHFCCIPDYKVLEESARYDAAKRGLLRLSPVSVNRSRSKRRCSSLVRGRTSSRQTRGTPETARPDGRRAFLPPSRTISHERRRGSRRRIDGRRRRVRGGDRSRPRPPRRRARGSRRSTSGSSATGEIDTTFAQRSDGDSDNEGLRALALLAAHVVRLVANEAGVEASTVAGDAATRSRDRSSGFRPAPTTSLRSRRSSRVT